MKLELLGLFLVSIISAVTARNGRGEVCELTEEEIKDLWSCHGHYGENGIFYDVFHVSFIILFMAATAHTYYLLKISTEGLKWKKWQVNHKVLLINFFALLSRLLWFICVINGRDYSVSLFGEVGNIFFLRVTQVFALAELLLLFLTWREIVRSSQKMTKVDNDFVVKAVYALVAFFMLVPVPVEVAGFWMFGTQDSICHDIAITTFMFGLLSEALAGVYYQRQVGKLIAKSTAGKKTGGASDAVKEVQRAITIVLLCAFTMLTAYIWYMSGTMTVDGLPGFWALVHGSELVAMTSVAQNSGSAALKKRKKSRDAAKTVGASSVGASQRYSVTGGASSVASKRDSFFRKKSVNVASSASVVEAHSVRSTIERPEDDEV